MASSLHAFNSKFHYSVGKIEKNSWKNSFGYALKFIEINLGMFL